MNRNSQALFLGALIFLCVFYAVQTNKSCLSKELVDSRRAMLANHITVHGDEHGEPKPVVVQHPDVQVQAPVEDEFVHSEDIPFVALIPEPVFLELSAVSPTCYFSDISEFA
jgi:hypothetical protein